MSDRPAWMPAVRWVETISYLAQIDAEAVFYRAGLRAQIALMEEMPMSFVHTGNRAILCTNTELWRRKKTEALRRELNE